MSCKFSIVVALLLAGGSQLAFGQAACKSTDPPNCALYKDCIDANCKCAGKTYDYSANFGPKYCGRFKQNNAFSTAGKAWRDKTLKCLSEQASQAFVAQPVGACNCEKLQKAMIRSHTPCYVSEPSFCDLSDADLRVAARIVDAYDFISLEKEGVIELGKTLVACAKRGTAARSGHITKVFISETLTEGNEAARTFAAQVLESTAIQADKAGLTEFAKAVRKIEKDLLPGPPLP